MAVSTRIIRVIDNQYTLELELEVDSPDDLLPELRKTQWGKKLAYLLSKMLPEVPELQTEDQTALAQAEEERIKENEEKLREQGRAEIRSKYYGLDYAEIQKRATDEAETRIRRKYIDYIKRKCIKVERIPEGKDGCFGTYDATAVRCEKCASKAECIKETGIRKRMNQIQSYTTKEIQGIYSRARDRGVM